MLMSINALIAARLSKEKDKTAKAAIEKAEKEFAEDCEKDIKNLEAKKAILVQKKAEHVFNPPKSQVMELELEVSQAETKLEEAIDSAKSNFVRNLVDQALEGEVSKETFRLLYRLQKKDLTLVPLQSAAKNLENAKAALNALQKDETITSYDAQIEKLDAEIALLKDMLK